jgi:nicotinate phosphoribosyltransferase
VKKDKPIITSLTQTDFYKFTMGQVIHQKYHDVPVTFGLKNRTKGVKLGKIIDIGRLREELDHVRTIKGLNKSELHYLRGTNEYQTRMFGEPFLDFLGSLQLPDYHLEKRDDEIILEFEEGWSGSMSWEIPGLIITNTLYGEALMKPLTRFEQEAVYAEGIRRLYEKIKILKANPQITFSEFGTRRAFSPEWQERVVQALAEELEPTQFLGTSNTFLAMKHALLPMGTSAHEMYMVLGALMGKQSDEALYASVSEVLQDWWDAYGVGLSIALPDTFGSDSFFKIISPAQARRWKGLRQDSGDPIAFGEKTIAFYKQCGFTPEETAGKVIVFSDGLELPKMIELEKHFRGRIKTTFGWGTNLTNDVGFPPLSIVIKVIEAAGQSAVKLSDNPAKSMGSPEEVERYKRVFGYGVHERSECKY